MSTTDENKLTPADKREALERLSSLIGQREHNEYMLERRKLQLVEAKDSYVKHLNYSATTEAEIDVLLTILGIDLDS